ncbi:MAG TPA: anthranilate phosphoribosyltransferase [Candidatus Eisenbacteria bacterium]|nr:anthranilate phosphoribosyltransferase [Candidatus Eisenbacteria bacterium]
MISLHLPRLREGATLTREEAANAVRAMMRGEAEDPDIAEFLTLLATRGETDDELLGGAEALRAEAIPFPGERGDLLDTCGTGGDASGTFNISTAVAFVVAGAGVRVAKHGNRSVSSKCGSADLLEALGAAIDLGPDAAARVLDETGFTFLYARRYHPAMKRVAAVRQSLGIRTLFNWLGPLANPARASHQLLGVPDGKRAWGVARVLSGLGVTRGLVVHGAGGLDELALAPGNIAIETGVAMPEGKSWAVDPPSLGLPHAPAESLRGGDANRNAAILRGILSGERGPARDAVVLNAAAALTIAGRTATLADGARLAREMLDEGAALRTMERYVAASRREGAV